MATDTLQYTNTQEGENHGQAEYCPFPKDAVDCSAYCPKQSNPLCTHHLCRKCCSLLLASAPDFKCSAPTHNKPASPLMFDNAKGRVEVYLSEIIAAGGSLEKGTTRSKRVWGRC